MVRVAKLLLILLLACIVAAVAAVFWWKHQVRSRLQAQTDAIHARGEPVTFDEITYFRQGQLPPERNAFTLYTRANESLEALPADILLPATGYNEASAKASIDLLNNYPVWRREHADETAAFFNACQPALDLIRQARGMDGVPPIEPDDDWPPPLDQFFPTAADARLLAKLSLFAATTAHEAGDDREAFEHLQDILQLRDLVGEHPTLITALVQAAITNLAAEGLEHITPTLNIGDGPGEVSLAEIRELAGQLLASERLLDVAGKAMISERVFVYEAIRSDKMKDGLHGTSPILKTIAPTVIDANLAMFLRYYSIKSSKLKTAGRYNSDLDITEEDREWMQEIDSEQWGRVKSAIYLPFIILCPSIDKFDIQIYRGLATQRMAGLALLMRAHEVETGRPVATLNDLAPRYLTALPEDPFSPTGQPPRYIADGPHPRLYCLNNNQQDDGGDFVRTKKTGGDPPDWPFFLNDTRRQAEGRDDQPEPAKPPGPPLFLPNGQVNPQVLQDAIKAANATQPETPTATP